MLDEEHRIALLIKNLGGNNTVKCIHVARQQLGKRISATTNTSIARQRRGKHAFARIREAVFSMWSVLRIDT
jgi:hypothetical protein